jgi:hypothetical protein
MLGWLGLCAGPSHATQTAPRALLAPVSVGEPLALPEVDPSIPSPSDFLGYPLGARFTHHAALVAYLERLAASSPRVRMWRYGETYEGRPLVLLAISSAENLERLEDLRQRHLRLASAPALPQAELDALVFTQPAFAWLAYGVHGNEASGPEAAMATAYLLAAGRGEWEALLRDVVVLLDPASNPDGRERYVGGYEQRRGREVSFKAWSYEHSEPWPGGRFNHYGFDLNRDWAWATQQETRQRLEAFRLWEPLLYVDVHEMGAGSTYYFPPPADPVHPLVDARTNAWFEAFSREIAGVFDRHGWLYFNRERYDLFYPGYGDSYPSLRGSVGMTFEMAGGGRAGLGLELVDGSKVTLADRATRHLASSLATVRATARYRVDLLKDFAALRAARINRLGETYLWDARQPEAEALARLLVEHGIRVQQLEGANEVLVYPLGGGKQETRRFAAGSYAVSTTQPAGALIEALLRSDVAVAEPVRERLRRRVAEGGDVDLYDLTAWSLPLAYGLEAWRSVGVPSGARPYQPRAGRLVAEGPVAYLVVPQGLAGYRLAAALLREKVQFRLAREAFEQEGRSFPAGTLVVPRLGNPSNLAERLSALALATGVQVQGTASSRTDRGLSLGSDDLVRVRPVRVALAIGNGTQATSAGTLWHLLDRDLELPVEVVDLGSLRAEPWAFDVLLLPEGGGYADQLGERGAQTLERWVRAGGVVVAVGSAVSWLREAKLVPLKAWAPQAGAETPKPGGQGFADRTLEIPGAALATGLRFSHPLAAGLSAAPPVLFQGSEILLPTGSPQEDLWWVRLDRPVLAGLVWPEAEPRLAGALLAHERVLGRGRIVSFSQDPAYRLFWRASTPLLLNAVLFSASW